MPESKTYHRANMQQGSDQEKPVASSASQSDVSQELARGGNGKRLTTEGEKRFDWYTYMGIGYFVNAAISVGAVYWAERTKAGQKTLQSVGKSLAKTFGANADRMTYLAKKSLLLTGGFAVLLPMKRLEDNKAEHVKALNRKIYGEQAERDPVIVQAQKELEEAPKQGWGSLASSRALALVPFYMLMGMLWDNKSTISRVTNPAFKGIKNEKALRALEIKTGTEAFNQTASKGWFIERPVAFISRHVGKGWAKITGNKQALEETKQLQKQHPGVLHTVEQNGKIGGDTTATALTHISITEAVTSYVVAKSVYWLSRILGPVFDTAAKSGQYANRDYKAYRPADGQAGQSSQSPKHTPEKLADTPESRIATAGLITEKSVDPAQQQETIARA